MRENAAGAQMGTCRGKDGANGISSLKGLCALEYYYRGWKGDSCYGYKMRVILFISGMDLNLRVLLDYIHDIKVRILHLLLYSILTVITISIPDDDNQDVPKVKKLHLPFSLSIFLLISPTNSHLLSPPIYDILFLYPFPFVLKLIIIKQLDIQNVL